MQHFNKKFYDAGGQLWTKLKMALVKKEKFRKFFLRNVNKPWEMTYNFIFPADSNFPIVFTLLWKIKMLFWETEITLLAFFLCLHLKTNFWVTPL